MISGMLIALTWNQTQAKSAFNIIIITISRYGRYTIYGTVYMYTL